MEEKIKELLNFILENKTLALGALAGIWILIIIITAIIAFSSKPNNVSQIDEEAINERLREEAKDDEKLLTRGLILSTEDNTPIEKIRLYSRQRRKKFSVLLEEEGLRKYGREIAEIRKTSDNENEYQKRREYRIKRERIYERESENEILKLREPQKIERTTPNEEKAEKRRKRTVKGENADTKLYSEDRSEIILP